MTITYKNQPYEVIEHTEKYYILDFYTHGIICWAFSQREAINQLIKINNLKYKYERYHQI